MPVNAGIEYYKAEKEYFSAKSKEEKIKALEKMISSLPRHKGTHNVLAQLKRRLSKLKNETSIKAASKPEFIIRKEGSAQVCIIGLTNSGKSSLLNSLTNTKAKIADYEYTTKKPEVGMMDYHGAKIQLIEIPSTFTSSVLSPLHSCDLILILLDAFLDVYEQMEKLTNLLSKRRLENKKILAVVNKSDIRQHKNVLSISVKNKVGLEELKNKIWSSLNLIRVYTKIPGKEKSKSPVTLPPGSTVKDVTEHVHKTLLKDFKFARIFNSTKFSGRKVGLAYKLNDMDVVEIHAG